MVISLSSVRAKLATTLVRRARTREEQWYLARFDAPCGLIEGPRQDPERVSAAGPHRLNWYLPPFRVGAYGGVMTILRAADHMRRRHNVEQGFVICGDGDADAIRRALGERFESLQASDVTVLGDAQPRTGVPPADFSIATHWTTAYEVVQATATALRFYFIQDWEPGFYPAGTIALQAEATYRLGLLGICNTEFLRDKYANEYGVRAVGFTPCVDADVFYPPAADQRSATGKMRLFFYGRPDHPRNCFELAAEALRRVKRRHGDKLEIVSAGAEWRPRSYGLEGVVENLGVLRYDQTGELYRTCHVGVSLMGTLHPSYIPIELMACGALVVSNHNHATRWCLTDKRNCLLAHGTPDCLSTTLSDAISRFDELGDVRARGVASVAERHSDWSAEMEKIAAFVLGAPTALALASDAVGGA